MTYALITTVLLTIYAYIGDNDDLWYAEDVRIGCVLYITDTFRVKKCSFYGRREKNVICQISPYAFALLSRSISLCIDVNKHVARPGIAMFMFRMHLIRKDLLIYIDQYTKTMQFDLWHADDVCNQIKGETV
jgi:hypothetical protein